jgi:hypothetical protein
MMIAPHHDPAYLATTLTQLSQQLADDADIAGDELTRAALTLACETVPGARWASLTHRPGRPRTMAASDPSAAALDEFQYRAGTGPCLTALATGSPVASEFATEDRWPAFTALALAETSARASLSLPLAAAGQAPISLNLYTDEAGAADSIDQPAAHLAAAALALSLTAISQRERLRNLEIALASSRLIGAAIGILMHRHRWTYQQSFDALRAASQHGHRRLRDIADDVVMLGDLPS